jgi:N-acetylmuramoyl-L-alanine amidase
MSNAVLGYAIDGDRTRTAIRFDLGGPTEVHARSLAKPPRVIVDLPETEFRLPPASGRSGQGLVASFRFGLIEAGKSRIVIDTAEPARVARAEVVLANARGAFQLEIELVPTTERELAAIELAEAALTFKPAVPEAKAPSRPGLPERPVVVVDAGHGGIDTGASGARLAEKDLVLAVAREVERQLRTSGRYQVVMTRTRDVFISLDERVAISRRHNADLFISLHADSLPDRESAKAVRGATVYTLAEQASDDLTRRVAENENAVDLLAGFSVSLAGDDQVRDILLDLMRRESHTFAAEFRQLLIGTLGSGVLLSRDPYRSGPFKVLRQPSSPAVLVELGYISNPEDERLMQQPAWQAKVAAAVLRAVNEHFRQRRQGSR